MSNSTFAVAEKAGLVEQLQSLNNDKEELITQVAALTIALEQERSKIHALQDELRRFHMNARKRNDSHASNK